MNPEKPAVFTPVSPEEIPAEASQTPAETVEKPDDDVETLAESSQTPAETVETLAEPEVSSAQPPALTLAFNPPPDAPFQTSLPLSFVCSSPTAQIFYALGARDVGQNALLFDPKDKILLTSTTDIAAFATENGARSETIVGTFEIKKPLWLELEPADQSDAVPHKIAVSQMLESGWNVAAASVRGKLHAHRALWREDSFGFGEAIQAEENGARWTILAVSDGAGSAPLSRVGSKIACETAVGALQGSLQKLPTFAGQQDELVAHDLPRLRDALAQSASAALEAIRLEAEGRGKPLTAFAATLLILVYRRWNGVWLCASLQIGDGAIALLDGENFSLLGAADHGQHSSETRFLTTGGIEAEFPHRFKISLKPSLRAVLLVSDGVSDDYFPEDKRIGEVFEAVLPLVQNAQDAGDSLISWLGYEKKGSSDDRTLVVAKKQHPKFPQIKSLKAKALRAKALRAKAPPMKWWPVRLR